MAKTVVSLNSCGRYNKVGNSLEQMPPKPFIEKWEGRDGGGNVKIPSQDRWYYMLIFGF